MLWFIAGLLVVLWALGFFVAHLGDLIHLLLVLAAVVLLGNVFRGVGRRERV